MGGRWGVRAWAHATGEGRWEKALGGAWAMRGPYFFLLCAAGVGEDEGRSVARPSRDKW